MNPVKQPRIGALGTYHIPTQRQHSQLAPTGNKKLMFPAAIVGSRARVNMVECQEYDCYCTLENANAVNFLRLFPSVVLVHGYC